MAINPWTRKGTFIASGITPPGFVPVTEEVLSALVARIVDSLAPEKIILFGSYVYGQPSKDSDVDLLVIMETDARPVDRYISVSRLIRPRPFPLDILVKTPQEITQAVAQGDPFLRELTNCGRVLYERTN